MPFTFYRGDSRTSEEIKVAGGFQAWVPLSAEQAQLLVMKSTPDRVKVDDTKFPPSLQRALGTVSIKKPIDLQAFIKWTKNKTSTPQVSTSYDAGCGGQASGSDAKGRPFFVYEIEFEGLSILQGDGSAVLATENDFPHQGVHPKIVISGTELAKAEVVAIMMRDEIAFLTEIPLPNIKRVGRRDPNTKALTVTAM